MELLRRPVEPAASTAGDSDTPVAADGFVTHHWVDDAEWGEIEEIVVYGDAA
jgi:hypothetical protein